MTGTGKNIEGLLNRLADNSRSELELVRTLADAIRRVDDQMLREIRGLTIQHQIRRETIVGELHSLAGRLCNLPVKHVPPPTRATIEQRPNVSQPGLNDDDAATESIPSNGGGADWRQAAKNIENELDYILNAPAPRH